MATRTPWQETKNDLLPYLRRLIVTVIVIAFALLLWTLKEVLLLAFAAALVAIALLAAGGMVHRWTGLGHRASLAIGGVLAFAVFFLVWWFAWPSISTQMPALAERLTDAVNQLETQFGISLPESAEEVAQAFTGVFDQLWSGLLGVVSALVGALTTFVLVVVAGIFMASSPTSYREGLVLLFPKTWHEKIRRALDETGTGLRLWLRAQGLAMLVVGTLIGLGAWAIGLPAPLALGLIACLTEFVPILGPIIGTIPALLVAFGMDGNQIIWTIVLYISVQQIEANLLTPMLQRRIVSIPPVVLLFSFVSLGVLFGILGVIVAAPLTIALYILVREFYVADLLDEREHLEALPTSEDLPPQPEAPPEPPKGPKEPSARRVRAPRKPRAATG